VDINIIDKKELYIIIIKYYKSLIKLFYKLLKYINTKLGTSNKD